MARDDYIEVSERLRTFIEMYPQGSLDSEWCYVQRDGEEWLVVKAYAYRDQDDKRPGVGHAWEPIPGRTPYTRGSELQVGETSAWGRALAALGIAVHKGVASANEVRAAQARTAMAEGWKSARASALSKTWATRLRICLTFCDPCSACPSALLRRTYLPLR